mmetsp:Transcript_10586/g.11420  ORF Transcript_10586/g.11420 Transcript_10586/m.11420 type:complete len:310 (-) Transcript_10586:821-1750(-)|eukprot:gene12755-13974_t
MPSTDGGKGAEKKPNDPSSGVNTGDVKVAIPPNVQSLITQVSRDDPAIRTTQNHVRNPKPQPQKRSFFARLLCCAPKSVNVQNGNQNGLQQPHTSPNITKQVSTVGNSSVKSIEVTATGRSNSGKKCLALDLDETLVHSSFQPVENASFVISVVIEGLVHNVFVLKRPGVDEFIERLAQCYELIVYTASLSKYADPLLDLLDPKKLISRRLFRESCVFYDGHYVKDLTVLNRDISQTIIVDNSPMSYIFQPENAIDCTSYFDDPSDVELWQIADFLEGIRNCDDVRAYCRHWREWCRNNPSSVPKTRRN